MRNVVIAFAAVLTCHPLAFADELDRSRVSADAAWLLHVDVEAAVGSHIGRYVIEHADELDIDMSDMESFESETGIDPLQDLFGVTVYGRDEPGDRTVAVVSISDAIESLLAQAQHDPDHYRTMKVDGRTIHVWEEDEGPAFFHVGPGAFVDRRTVVISGTVETVAAGVDVVEGGAPSLGGAERPLIKAEPHHGSFLFAAATALPWLEWGDEPAAEIARRSSDISLDLGEREESIYLDLAAATRNESDASNIADVMRGLLALGRLIADSDPELADLRFMIDAVEVSADGNAIRVEMRQATEAVIKGLQASVR